MRTIFFTFILTCCSLISQAQIYPVNANLEEKESFSQHGFITFKFDAV